MSGTTERAATPDERFAALAERLQRDTDAAIGMGGKKGFGSSSLTIGGKIFAMLVRERLVLKLPRKRVDALVAAEAGERFDPGHGRLMKEWLSLDPDAGLDWQSLAEEAMAFVAGR